MNWDPPETETATDRDWGALARQWWWIPVVGALSVVAVLALVTYESEEPDIHPAIKESTDTLESLGDCRGLQDAFDRHDEADVLGYIDDALRDAGCYD